MKEELKREAEKWQGLVWGDSAKNEMASLIRKLRIECERLSALSTELTMEIHLREARIAELEQRAEQPALTFAETLQGPCPICKSVIRQRVEQPKPEPVAKVDAPCSCGLHQIPSHVDGVKWYWQLHKRDACTLELPNERCWCGLLRSEHLKGHADTAPPAIPEPKPEPVAQCEIVRVSPGMHRLDWNDPDWWASLPVGKHTLYTSAPPAITEGYALVPIEPTDEMMDAVYAAAARGQLQGSGWDQTYRRVYRAMVRAAKVQP